MNTEMSVNEAIERISDHMRVHKLSEPRAHYINTAFEMAIAALERSDAMKPIKNNAEIGNVYCERPHYSCPHCEMVLTEICKYELDYCPACGQRLDWANVASEED